LNTDLQLIEQIKAGNQKAFDTLFTKYYKYLVVTAYQYVKEDHLAKDMVQEIFCDLWHRREEVTIDNPKAFLRQSVVYKCLATIRKNSRVNLEEDSLTIQNESKKYVDEEVSFNEVNAFIKKVVSELPERCREVFELSRYEQLSHKEIAERLGISKKTIENQMTKALKTLRNALKENGFLEIIIFLLFWG
jgi:RNA polymerase sigma-70 factor (ECF subfamily)